MKLFEAYGIDHSLVYPTYPVDTHLLLDVETGVFVIHTPNSLMFVNLEELTQKLSYMNMTVVYSYIGALLEEGV